MLCFNTMPKHLQNGRLKARFCSLRRTTIVRSGHFETTLSSGAKYGRSSPVTKRSTYLGVQNLRFLGMPLVGMFECNKGVTLDATWNIPFQRIFYNGPTAEHISCCVHAVLQYNAEAPAKWAFEGKIPFTTPYQNREIWPCWNDFNPMQMEMSMVRVP